MDFQFKSIDHFQLASPKGSEDISRKFYHGILKLREVEKPASLKVNGGVWFEAGSVNIHIGIEEPFIPARKAHPALEIEHLSGLKQHLTQNDISFIEDERLPGADRIYVADPFGNRIEILEWK
ncbi:glyoxalase [Bacillus sp. mrc49]|uniref:glyoxalase n=1 Tax=Bacillus sp. mrc49 TaxID=2054913 RepID=UPI000C272C45|nr:glyoxalase [Bacillus sp. mrc49]PJN90410.1 glyoxalase [Bacillus sp. mrc49]